MQSNVFHKHNHFGNTKLMLFPCLSAYIIKQINRKKKKSLSIFLAKQPIFISRFFPPSEKIVQLRNNFFYQISFFHWVKNRNILFIFLEAFFRFSAKSKRQKIPVTVPKGFSNASLFSPPLPKFFTPIPRVSGE